MLQRYPHNGLIKRATEVTGADGIPSTTYESKAIKGRYEPAGAGRNKNVEYSAVFYSPVVGLEPFQGDGHLFIYEGREFKIALLHNYQTHCEIWLE